MSDKESHPRAFRCPDDLWEPISIKVNTLKCPGVSSMSEMCRFGLMLAAQHFAERKWDERDRQWVDIMHKLREMDLEDYMTQKQEEYERRLRYRRPRAVPDTNG